MNHINERLFLSKKKGRIVKSYIEIYRPPIKKAIIELQKLAEELPTISKRKISWSVTLSGEIMKGDFDFALNG